MQKVCSFTRGILGRWTVQKAKRAYKKKSKAEGPESHTDGETLIFWD